MLFNLLSNWESCRWRIIGKSKESGPWPSISVVYHYRLIAAPDCLRQARKAVERDLPDEEGQLALHQAVEQLRAAAFKFPLLFDIGETKVVVDFLDAYADCLHKMSIYKFMVSQMENNAVKQNASFKEIYEQQESSTNRAELNSIVEKLDEAFRRTGPALCDCGLLRRAAQSFWF